MGLDNVIKFALTLTLIGAMTGQLWMKNLCSFTNRQGSPIFLVAKAQGFYRLRRVELEIIALAINQKSDDKSRGSR
jgi:hypothetical protein